jgi:hypothetical protein
MNKDILLKYAQLKIKAAEIETELDFLKEEALKQVLEIRGDSDQPVELQEFPNHKFSIMKRKTWKYPEEIVTMEKLLKEGKASAEATGEATFTEKEILLFTTPKK